MKILKLLNNNIVLRMVKTFFFATLIMAFDHIIAQDQINIDQWKPLGPTVISGGRKYIGRITSIAVHPQNPQVMYVGARGSGVWKTTNGGISWSPISDQLSTLTIQAIAIAPSSPSRVYITTPKGIYRSNDFGEHWTLISNRNFCFNGFGGAHLIVHPTNPDIIFGVGKCAIPSGIYKSLDGGENWQISLQGVNPSDLIMDPSNSNILYASLSGNTAMRAGIYVSTNLGVSWQILKGCLDGLLPVLNIENTIHISLSSNTLFASFKTADGYFLYSQKTSTCLNDIGLIERAWKLIWTAPTDEGNALHYKKLWSGLHSNPINPKLIFICGTQLYRSDNGGESFQVLNEMHADQHAFLFYPISPNKIFLGNDGGIYTSTENGKTGSWQFIGEGISNVEFYEIADGVSNSNLLIGGTQDNGTSKYNPGNTIWKYLTGGDSEFVEVDPNNSNNLFEIGQSMHQLHTSSNGGSRWSTISTNFQTDCDIKAGENPGTTLNQFIIHPLHPNIMLATCHSVWKGNPFSIIFTPPIGNANCINIEPKNDYYISSTTRGSIYIGISGLNWIEVFTHPFNQPCNDIEIDIDNSNQFFAVFNGSRQNRVFQYKRTNQNPLTFSSSDITSNLPENLLVKTIAKDLNHKNRIYIGTNEGLYCGKSFDEGLTWTWSLYSNGMPQAVDVRDIDINPKTDIMRIATFGRGAFEVHSDYPIGSVLDIKDKINLLRVHDVGTGYGPSSDALDVEVVITLNSEPNKYFGFKMRIGTNGLTHKHFLETLRFAFKKDLPVKIEYIKTGIHSGEIFRVILL
ncbi:MAG: hypothetical protein IPO85_05720 [Saprospiraceae bacterium]|uniref:Sortilin N-terminal domain-containing protein n=1 Tax=Candidatus Defluviibacterium haderslevense TaxID=2981993 RepID=A0A9D7S6X7_9BACT|nr:hypothetical protein [Candidatus Defluviibacterium haderslevense]